MRIFLTGGTGFFGRHLVPLLHKHQVLLLSRQEQILASENIQHLQGNLDNIELWQNRLREFSPEVCIHLAWEGLPNYSLEQCLKNFNSSTRLLEALANINCGTVFVAGTCWEYGNLQGQVKETDIPSAMNLFASFKTGLRLIGESLINSKEGCNFIWGRIFFSYGIGQRESSLIPSCYRSLKSLNTLEIKTPEAANDFIHMQDIATAIVALIETPNLKGTFNIGSGKPTRVIDIARQIASKVGKADLVPSYENLDTLSGIWAENSLIYEKTGWKPQISVAEGLSRTIDEMKENGNP